MTSALEGGAGATVLIGKDPMEVCVVEGCNHRRYWHNGNDGDGECSRADCHETGAQYPSDSKGGAVTA